MLLPIQTTKRFTYASENMLRKGSRLIVEFNRKPHVGICGDQVDAFPKSIAIKPVSEVLDEMPVFSESLLRLGEWMANYY
ncbi:MAG: hypothetical protein FJ042_08950, partial [Candidatus Cloacimonetes bacterium]|nr:hypothetical protein [Candidatus Cloacimonadota bacterium]